MTDLADFQQVLNKRPQPIRNLMNQNIQNYRQQHENMLMQILNKTEFSAVQLKEAILYSLFPGGKRIRPILVYLFGKIIGVAEKTLDIIAVSIELMHTYSLVHDDLPAMDNDDYRRNQPSSHKTFGEATAILVGDVLQTLAIDVLVKYLSTILPATQVIKIIQVIVAACGTTGMISGQYLDIVELSQTNIKLEQLKNIHSLKTGELFLACLNMVLIAGFPSTPIARYLNEYINRLGLVFQMQDDYLDHYGEIKDYGKNRASDVVNKKFTFANFYSKNDLFNQITTQFTAMKNSLAPFANQTQDLLALTRYLEQRTIF